MAMQEPQSEALDWICADSRALRLYEQARDGGWNVDGAVDWSSLTFQYLPARVRNAMALIYGDILFAESFGIGVTLRMEELAPAGFYRDFAAFQVRDEARHTDFFARVMAKLGCADGASPELALLRDELGQTRDYTELMIHGQVIEVAARILFVENGKRALERMKGAIKLPGTQSIARLVQAVMSLIGRDEALHIAFGVHVLRERLGRCDAVQRHALERRAHLSATLMHRAFARRSAELDVLGAPAGEVLDQMWNVLRTQLGRFDLELGSPEAAP